MRKGFTLVELLAVIVILAVLALITTPILLNVIESSIKSTALNSAEGYVRAVSNYLIMNELSDGLYSVLDNNIKAEYTGTGPSNGSITIKKGDIESANLCINKYSIDYIDGVSSISENDYCKDTNNKTLIIKKNNEQVKKVYIGNSTNTSIEKEEGTNIVCNNGVTIKEEDGKIKIENILGNSECNFNSNLEDTINNIDNTKNNILLLSDIELENTLTIKEGKDVVIDLNQKNLSGYFLEVIGNLKVNGKNSNVTFDNHDEVSSRGASFHLQKNANVILNGGTYNGIITEDNSNIIINDSVLKCRNDVKDCYPIMVSGNSIATLEKVSVTSSGKAFGIYGNGQATIKNSNFNCISDNCVWDNSAGTLQIYNTTIDAYGYGIKNDGISIIKIKDNTILSSAYIGIEMRGIGSFNICDGSITGYEKDFGITAGEGYIYYNSENILKNGTKSDVNNPTHIILNDNLTCE